MSLRLHAKLNYQAYLLIMVNTLMDTNKYNKLKVVQYSKKLCTETLLQE